MKVAYIYLFHFNMLQEKKVPDAVNDVLNEELNKLGFLESHSSEFKYVNCFIFYCLSTYMEILYFEIFVE